MEELLQVSDIPASLKDEVVRRLADFCIGFLRVEQTPDGRDASILGSGILVRVGSARAILTAHHVLEKLPQSGRLSVFLSRTQHLHSLDTTGLTYVKIARGSRDSDGPDLGAVLLSPLLAGTIAAKKTFYNLDVQCDKLLNDPPGKRDGLWLVHGFAEENTSVLPDLRGEPGWTKYFYCFGGGTFPNAPVRIGEHDYVTAPVSPSSPPPTPKSFGGMSGGGLWQVPLKREESAELTHRTPLLMGVMFYQEAVGGVVTAIKCHGCQSLYGVAYNAIRDDRRHVPD